MARPHHRKKHKEHVRQFKHRGDFTTSKKTGKASYTFMIIGAIVGLLIGYFASQGAPAWLAIGLAAGGIGGYIMGRRTDAAK